MRALLAYGRVTAVGTFEGWDAIWFASFGFALVTECFCFKSVNFLGHIR